MHVSCQPSLFERIPTDCHSALARPAQTELSLAIMEAVRDISKNAVQSVNAPVLDRCHQSTIRSDMHGNEWRTVMLPSAHLPPGPRTVTATGGRCPRGKCTVTHSNARSSWSVGFFQKLPSSMHTQSDVTYMSMLSPNKTLSTECYSQACVLTVFYVLLLFCLHCLLFFRCLLYYLID